MFAVEFVAGFPPLTAPFDFLAHAPREYEQFYNSHRPHQGIANARPLRPLPSPITSQDKITRLNIGRRPRLGGILNEYHHAT
jgi:putative transposase